MGKSMRFRMGTGLIVVLIFSTVTLLLAQGTEKNIENSNVQKQDQSAMSEDSKSEAGEKIVQDNTALPETPETTDKDTVRDAANDDNADIKSEKDEPAPFYVQPAPSERVKPVQSTEAQESGPARDKKVRDQSLTHGLPGEKRVPLFDYYMSYGGFFPMGAYGDRYDPGHLATAGISLYRYNLWGIAPEVIFRYTNLNSIESENYPDSFFNIFQVSAGLIYRYEFIMYPSARMMTVFARITEGVSILQYHEEDSGELEEYINTLGVSAGLSIAVWKELRLGFEVGYLVIFTAGDYLQGFLVNVSIGYRY